ncbi:helix-turn-helix domain-containing protein [Bradyrhizobium japonicum]|uniref:helix-turn-helix domain-containing protein n=1 Tax=Bradyrhizobium japonicum TaxID=375 RepID=UPI0004284726|nr:helix-turn-helix transcriptional regulator [Bradyrhizobium japonicum]
MSNVVQFPGSRRTPNPHGISQSDRDYINDCINRKLAEMAPAAPIGEASVIAFPGPERRVSPPEGKRRYGRDDEWYLAFGRALFEARVKARVSIEDAAAAAERSVETWRNYENTGRGRLTFPLCQFARRYGIRLDDIFEAAEAALRH